MARHDEYARAESKDPSSGAYFPQPVARGDVVGLRQRGEIENRGSEVLDRSSLAHHHLSGKSKHAMSTTPRSRVSYEVIAVGLDLYDSHSSTPTARVHYNSSFVHSTRTCTLLSFVYEQLMSADDSRTAPTPGEIKIPLIGQPAIVRRIGLIDHCAAVFDIFVSSGCCASLL